MRTRLWNSNHTLKITVNLSKMGGGMGGGGGTFCNKICYHYQYFFRLSNTIIFYCGLRLFSFLCLLYFHWECCIRNTHNWRHFDCVVIACSSEPMRPPMVCPAVIFSSMFLRDSIFFTFVLAIFFATDIQNQQLWVTFC